jgi:inosose dehydratase
MRVATRITSFAFGSKRGFTLREEIASDLKTAERWIGCVAQFPGALVSGSATIVSEGQREDKFAVAAEFYNKAGEIGRKRHVDIAVHLSSHHNTLLFNRLL